MHLPITDTAEYISLVLSIPTIVLAVAVAHTYGLRAIYSVRKLRQTGAASLTEVDWLILGIVVGFTGAAADNIYWLFAWGAEFYNLSQKHWLFSNGVFSNIPFRQSTGIIAAALHLWPILNSYQRQKYTQVFLYSTAMIAIVLAVTKLSL